MGLRDVFTIREGPEDLSPEIRTMMDIVPWGFNDQHDEGYIESERWFMQHLQKLGFAQVPGQSIPIYYKTSQWQMVNDPEPGTIDVTHYDPAFLKPRTIETEKLVAAISALPVYKEMEEEFGVPHLYRLWSFGEGIDFFQSKLGYPAEHMPTVEEIYAYLGLDKEAWTRRGTERHIKRGPDFYTWTDED
jgi:hypothetical protein